MGALENRIPELNKVITAYFIKNPAQYKVVAKNLMPEFIKAGIYNKDHRAGLPLRNDLRILERAKALQKIPAVHPEYKGKNINWFFIRTSANTSTLMSNSIDYLGRAVDKIKEVKGSKSRDNSDEYYVIDLCDKVLGLKGSRQHKFDFIIADQQRNGNQGLPLPIDVYYLELNLVIEYREKQHTEPVKHFDKPDVMTVSGVSRGEQRAIYDQRRRDKLKEHNVNLIEIDYSELKHNSSKRLVRDRKADIKVIENILSDYK